MYSLYIGAIFGVEAGAVIEGLRVWDILLGIKYCKNHGIKIKYNNVCILELERGLGC